MHIAASLHARGCAELVARDGRRQALDLLVDTGNPCEVIIDIATMLRSS